jgi:glycosyltransferase involved in cell wall biosynthesis
MNQINYVVHYHGGNIRRFAFFKSFFYRKSKAIIVPTQADKEQISSEYKIDPRKIFVIPAGINTEFYTNNNKTQNNASYPTLCFSGILSERKSFKEALACLAYLKMHFPKVILEVAGDYENKNYAMECEEMIQKLELEKSIKLNGWVNKIMLKKIYSKSDLLLFPSKIEPLGRSLLEAMSCGTPAIALKTAIGPRIIIQHGKNGILTDLPNFNEATLKLLSDKNKLRMLSQHARGTVLENYSFQILYPKVEALYKNLTLTVTKNE